MSLSQIKSLGLTKSPGLIKPLSLTKPLGLMALLGSFLLLSCGSDSSTAVSTQAVAETGVLSELRDLPQDASLALDPQLMLESDSIVESELPPELLAAELELSQLELTNSLDAQELTLIAPPVLQLDPVIALSDAFDENPDGYPEFSWLDLVPENFYFSALLDQVQERFPEVDFAMMDDWDPMAVKALDYLRELTDAAPVREDLDGARIRIPGFLLPLDFEAQDISSFLLVPYFGACIHTPPPPANQIILVELDKPFRLQQMFEPVWVNGVLSAQGFESELAMAGYRIQAHLVELYDDFDY